VVWQIKKDSDANKANSSQSSTQKTLGQSTQQPKEGKLQGTKLANFTPVDKVDTLQKIDTKVGNGEEVKPGATVAAHYTGAVAKTGVIFPADQAYGANPPAGSGIPPNADLVFDIELVSVQQ
jgi:FKBP-type peptidyl-prolyl cis-trans isomerase